MGQKPLLHGRPSGVVAHGSAAADHSMTGDEDGDLQDSEGHCQSVRGTGGRAHGPGPAMPARPRAGTGEGLGTGPQAAVSVSPPGHHAQR